jgi:hypothetical protein
MQMKQIKVGMLVETPVGPGTVVRAGGTFPPSVEVEVQWFNGKIRRSYRPRELRAVEAPK